MILTRSFQLYEYHISLGSRIEASFCLSKIGESLSFSAEEFREEWVKKICPEASNESEVKELVRVQY